VPDRFTSVQWIRVPDGKMTPGLKALCGRLIKGGAAEPAAPRRRESRGTRVDPEALPPKLQSGASSRALPEFPVEDPEQRLKFWVHVIGWSFTSLWILFKRLPRALRAVAYIWLFVAVLAKGCSETHEAKEPGAPEAAEKLKALSEAVHENPPRDDTGIQGVVDIARAVAEAGGKIAKNHVALLAIPFGAGAGATPESKFADSAFTLLYGRLAVSRQGVGISKEPVDPFDISVAADRGRAGHARYVLCGSIDSSASAPVLTVDVVNVADGSLAWTKSYPLKDGDPSAIASDVEAHVPALDED
jgi:hypothetical protein